MSRLAHVTFEEGCGTRYSCLDVAQLYVSIPAGWKGRPSIGGVQ